MSMTEIERRTIPSEATLEYRDDPRTGEKTPVIVGYAAVFNSESRNLGGFVEVMEPRAFDKVLRGNPDVVAVWNHNKDMPLGRVADGRLKLSVDPHGLRYEVTPDQETSIGKDVTIWVKNRTVQASSFAFAVNRDSGERWEPGPNGLRKRTITEVALLDDVSPVLRPAYDATSVVVSRRALEMAAGEANRPNQTMANAAKRGLKVAAGRSDVDSALLSLGERIAERQILTSEDVFVATERLERCLAAKSATWAGTPAWIEYQLLGGDSGERWIQRRGEQKTENTVVSTSADEVGEPEERAEGVNLKPTAGMASAARRGLKLHEDGRSGDGLKPETVSRAKRIAARETLTPSHVREMRAWFRRHKVDRRPGWDKAGDESPGYTAWLLWGGAPAWRWAEAKVAEMERAAGARAAGDDAEMYAAFIDTAVECRAMEDGDDMNDHPEKIRMLYDAIRAAEGKFGPWTKDDEHYMNQMPCRGEGYSCRIMVDVEGDSDDGKPEADEKEKRSEQAPVVAESATTEDAPPPPTPQQREDAEVIAAIASMNAVVLATHLHGADVAG